MPSVIVVNVLASLLAEIQRNNPDLTSEDYALELALAQADKALEEVRAMLGKSTNAAV